MLTNLHDNNPWRSVMEYVCDWNVIHRSKAQFQSICEGTAERGMTTLETITDAEELTAKAMEMESEIYAETWGVFPMYNGPWIITAKEGLANLTPEPYRGLDLFGVSPVENVGWEATE